MPRRRRAPTAVLTACLAALLGACGTPESVVGPATATTSDRPGAELIYLAPAPGDTPAFLPAFRGAEVALAVAALDGVGSTVTWIEVPTDLAGWSPPADAVAAIVAPGTPSPLVAALAAVLEVPTVSLAGGTVGATWRTIAAGDRAIAAAMLAEGGDAPCLVVGADGHAFAAAFAGTGVGTAPARLRAGAVLRDPDLVAGCTAVLWPGAGEAGAALRVALAAVGAEDLPFIASDRLRDGAFETAAGAAGRGVLVVSGAIDVATRLDLGSRRFVQDYQAEVGLPPGPFSVEGWDAARLLLLALREGWPEAFAGVGERHDLARDDPPVTVYRLTRGGWRPV